MVGEMRKERILVLVTSYPTSAGGVSLMYVHVRNLWYAKSGLQLDVLNLSATRDDYVDGIRVICKDNYVRLPSDYYGFLIVHAPNIRQHYFFLKKYGERFGHFLFFFHGHEVLKVNDVYSKPYPFARRSRLANFAQDVYDFFKLRVWRKYFEKNYQHVFFIFVSNWMKEQFLKWTKLNPEYIEGRSATVYNSIHPVFEARQWDPNSKKKFDFITIRSNWDGSKYAVDIVNKLATDNPENSFLLIGKGVFFKHFKKADNLTLLERHLQPEEMIPLLNSARYALMPTRTDAQGLMMCEMASFGMPVITSDIPVCHEIFCGFCNVLFLNNEEPSLKIIDDYDNKIEFDKMDKFYVRNTVNNEIEILLALGV